LLFPAGGANLLVPSRPEVRVKFLPADHSNVRHGVFARVHIVFQLLAEVIGSHGSETGSDELAQDLHDGELVLSLGVDLVPEARLDHESDVDGRVVGAA
jgi:hypothetical protein